MKKALDMNTVSYFILAREGGANAMNQIQTISTVSKNLAVSSRMLRYYDDLG